MKPNFAKLNEPLVELEPVIDIGPDGRSLDLLQSIYRNTSLPLSTRRNAAVAALPFEFPKLAVTALVPPDQDFAALLDQRLQRINKMKLVNAKPDEGCIEKIEEPKAEEGRVTDLTLPPPIPDRRSRRRV